MRIAPCVVALASLMGAADRASACSCFAEPSPCAAYDAAEAAFAGRVIEVRREGPLQVARLEVERVWKGTVDRVVTLGGEAGSSCSFQFTAGDRFIVYGRLADGMYRPHVCGGSGLLRPNTAYPDLPPVRGRVDGRVAVVNEHPTDRDQMTLPLGDARVWIETPSGVVEARSAADGSFTLDGVPPGEHAIHVVSDSGLEGSGRAVLRSALDCDREFLIAEPSGRIAGRLTSESGTPIGGTKLQAIPVNHEWTKRDWTHVGTTTSQESGEYEFRRLKPGRYFVAVNALEPPRVGQPFPATYYPGVERREDAVLIDVGHADAGPLDAFVLRKTVSLTHIVAEIVCQDGSRPRSGLVDAARADERSYLTETTHEKTGGQYRLTVLQDTIYDVAGAVLVHARDESGRETEAITTVRTPAVRVDSAAPPAVVELVAPLQRCEQTTIDGTRPPRGP